MRKRLILENVVLELEVEEHISHLVFISVICFVLWLALRFVLIGLFYLVLQSPWLSSFRLFCHGSSLCSAHCISCREQFDLLTFVFHCLLPFQRTIELLIDSCNSFTQQWHQVLAGFQFEAAGPTLHLS